MENLPGFPEAQRAYRAFQSARAASLQVLERFVDGTQYNHLEDFFTGKCPLQERAPHVAYPIVKMAIESNKDLLLGEGRYPHVSVRGLEGDDSDLFEEAVSDISEQARLRASGKEVFGAAQGSKSCAAVFGLVEGQHTIQSVYARWCTPTFARTGAVESLEIQYPYLDVITDSETEKVVCKLFRRVIDSISDTTYKPATVEESDARHNTIAWVVDETLTVAHGFGFCPVIWYAHMRSCSVVNGFDGHAIHEHQLDEIRAHDFINSQWYRAAMYAGDPQWTEIGVRQGYNPAGGISARLASIPKFGDPYVDASGGKWVTEQPAIVQGGAARPKGPGVTWQYDTQDASKVKVTLHTLPGDALKAIEDKARDGKAKLQEALGVVLLDPSSLPNESRLSGKALESFMKPQLARVDSYRDDFGDHFLIPAIGMLLRISLVKGLEVKNLEVVQRVTSAKTWSWHRPPLTLEWGEYFKPTGEEEELLFRGTLAAVGILLTRRKAVEKLRNVLGVKDVEAYMRELDAEKAENDANALKTIEAEAKIVAANKPAPAAKPAPKAAART
jgi:hypothetical protein